MRTSPNLPPLNRAQQKLVAQWTGLSVRVVFQIFGRHDQDAISEGYIGLCRAAQDFDPNRGVKFLTYATWWIRAYVFRELMRQAGGDFRLGSTRRERDVFFRSARTRRVLEVLGVEPTNEAIAARLNVPPHSVAEVHGKMNRPVQIDHEIAPGVKIDLPSPEPISEELLIGGDEDDCEREGLRRAFARLEPRERTVISQRWMTNEVKTLATIGDQLGLSRERVRQIEAKAIEKLRGMINRRAA